MAINYHKDENNIVTLTMDLPGKSANVINMAFGEAFKSTIEKLKQDKDSISGIIITSAKETFLAGADIDEMFKETSAQKFYDRANEFKAEMCIRDRAFTTPGEMPLPMPAVMCFHKQTMDLAIHLTPSKPTLVALPQPLVQVTRHMATR